MYIEIGGRILSDSVDADPRSPEVAWWGFFCFLQVAMLRKHGVVGKFVEFHGPGLKALTLADRATIANMVSTCGEGVEGWVEWEGAVETEGRERR